MVTTLLLGVLGGGVGFGLWTAAGAMAPRATPGSSGAIAPRWRRHEGVLRRSRLAVALGAGLAALVLTRWPMAFLLGAAAVLGMGGLSSSRTANTVERLEAIASWTEMLRDTLAGASGLSQALVASAVTAPAILAGPLGVLAAQLKAGGAIEPALYRLADDIDDQAGDMVVASLLLASREQAQHLGELLSALAQATREEVTMRLSIEASRASSRTAVKMITGFSVGLFVLMAVFARSFLSPYGSPLGQLVLGFIGVLFGLGLFMMSVMIRTEPFQRILGGEAATS